MRQRWVNLAPFFLPLSCQSWRGLTHAPGRCVRQCSLRHHHQTVQLQPPFTQPFKKLKTHCPSPFVALSRRPQRYGGIRILNASCRHGQHLIDHSTVVSSHISRFREKAFVRQRRLKPTHFAPMRCLPSLGATSAAPASTLCSVPDPTSASAIVCRSYFVQVRSRPGVCAMAA